MVKIRMKMMGRHKRAFFRIVAIDGRQPRDGRELEVLGTYDPHVRDTDARVTLKPARIKYWTGVGAQVSEKCAVLFRKYMNKFENAAATPSSAAPETAAPAAAPVPAGPQPIRFPAPKPEGATADNQE